MSKETLRRSAASSAHWRGHRLRWTDLDPARAHGLCKCGAWVTVDTRPPANGIDIGGTAVVLNCFRERLEA